MLIVDANGSLTDLRFADADPLRTGGRHERDVLRIHESIVLGRARVTTARTNLSLEPAHGRSLELLEPLVERSGVVTRGKQPEMVLRAIPPASYLY